MNAPLTATVPGDGSVGQHHRAILATIPDRLRAVDSGGDVAMVAACAAGWTTRLVEIVRGGARGALIVDAGGDDSPDEIRAAGQVTREAGAVVLVDHPYAADQAWQRVFADWRRDAAEAVLLDSTTAVDDNNLTRALLEQLALVRDVLGPLEQLALVHQSTSAYQLAGHAGPVRLSISGTYAPCAALTVDLVGVGRRRQARFAPLGPATPARIADFGRAGARIEPPSYESGHRTAWRQLHAAVTTPDSAQDSRDLDLLAEDVERVDTLFGRRDPDGSDPDGDR